MIDIPTSVAEKVENTSTTEANTNTENTEQRPVRTAKVDAKGRAYGTGRRKNAAARVWIMPGKGKVTVNGRPISEYFKRPVLQMIINQPFDVTDNLNKFDIFCTVTGGGLSGQAGAVRHGISRALQNYNPETNHQPLRTGGFLTRDSRVVERKKYGRKKARKSFQFSKR